MAEIVALPWVETQRLVNDVANPAQVSLATAQALVDLCVHAGLFTQDQFYAAVNQRLSDMVPA
jgi:hypothetical protein